MSDSLEDCQILLKFRYFSLNTSEVVVEVLVIIMLLEKQRHLLSLRGTFQITTCNIITHI